MIAVDAIINAVIEALRKRKVVESTTFQGVVSAVGAGTIDVTRSTSLFPSVRLLTGYANPQVGDIVVIHKTIGGWVCLGKLQ